MTMRPIQITIGADLLAVIDADPEAQERGRSAFVRSAVRVYLKAKDRRAIDEAIIRAYADDADELLDEVCELIDGQAWPVQ